MSIRFLSLAAAVILAPAANANDHNIAQGIGAGTALSDTQHVLDPYGIALRNEQRFNSATNTAGFASRVSRWMDTSLSNTIRNFSSTASVGDGIDSIAGFRHSQTDDVDPAGFNADHRLNAVSEFFLSQRAGDNWINAMALLSDQEQRFDLGFKRGPLGLSMSQGRGHSLVRLGGNMNSLNPSLFNGVRDLSFEFSGLTATLDLNASSAVQYGQWTFDMQGLERRQTRFVGMSLARSYARFYDVSRASKASVARAVELGYSGDRFALGFRRIAHDSGARSDSLSMFTPGPAATRLGLTFGRDRNPLYLAGSDTRVLMTISGRFGGAGVLHASDTKTEEGEAEQQSNTARNVALIGGGAVLLAAAAGGGGGDSGSGASDARFAREQGAAFSVLNSINPRCVAENREFGGWVYRFSDGTYSYLTPSAGDTASVNIGGPERVPGGTTATATYHCHGGPDPRFNNEQFSPQDLFADRFFGVNGYLATPGGSFKKHDVRSGNILNLGSVKTR